jgi:uncharacterized UPF0160 family protein
MKRYSLPSKKFVEDAIKNRLAVHPSGEIIKLETAVAWKEHLLEMEKDFNIAGEIKFVLF